jgi:hypothetical protein
MKRWEYCHVIVHRPDGTPPFQIDEFSVSRQLPTIATTTPGNPHGFSKKPNPERIRVQLLPGLESKNSGLLAEEVSHGWWRLGPHRLCRALHCDRDRLDGCGGTVPYEACIHR